MRPQGLREGGSSCLHPTPSHCNETTFRGSGHRPASGADSPIGSVRPTPGRGRGGGEAGAVCWGSGRCAPFVPRGTLASLGCISRPWAWKISGSRWGGEALRWGWAVLGWRWVVLGCLVAPTPFSEHLGERLVPRWEEVG